MAARHVEAGVSENRVHVASHRDALFRFIQRRVRNPAVSEDIVQDTFVRFLGRQGSPAADVGALMRRIALNLVRDHFRADARRAYEPVDDTHPAESGSPEDLLMFRQRAERFGRILDAMPSLQRDVFIHRRLHGLSSKETAERLGLTPAAVDAHVARALVTLEKGLRGRKGDRR
jgi:RNA polymerase sigma factor (sigma-70 family)